ncbi:PLP-dependent aminotransferase family protein [Pseudomonas typographi]|uniref:PLP-dependent aminotransferase family protein n=1 Tax=Pseudomonas typographi TaxID=2715964 RepID=A0ABR7YYS2_9PSED|nr:PLP-dependent aminotransferase family protein [Pseudomonas typographi]MBD1587802.1 PLP-dependent aminotransferase family protein [Pseudomonas typographi]MBD1598325.1 PLP-dependent aminotransferase family protein [Pseudomonas typographi]
MPKARYKQVVDRLKAAIHSGQLAPGTRLPTHRSLAEEHGLALATASRVYAELEAMGLVSGETGRGTFVRENALPRGLGVEQQDIVEGVVDLNFNYPILPGQADLLRSGLRQLAAAGDLQALLRYQPHAGRLHERAAVARYLHTHDVPARAEQVLITNGAQHGLAISLLSRLRAGDVVAADALTYPGFKVLAAALGIECVPLPAGDQGPDLGALARACSTRPVRAVYCMPTVHNPLGWVMPLEQRQRLVAIARTHDLTLIEDAAYAYLAAAPAPPLAQLAPERTLYVCGLSKSVATGLRIGFVAAPLAWVPALERMIRATTWNTPGVLTALATAWLEDGTVARLEAHKREDASRRQTIARDVLQGLSYLSHPASYFIWLPLAEDARADQVAMALLNAGICVATAEPFTVGAQVPHALRLALGSVPLATLRVALLAVRQVVEGAQVGVYRR